jgi:hypothetical protein
MLHPGAGHGFYEVKNISWARARNGGDCVQQSFLRHPEGLSDGLHQLFNMVAFWA